MRSGLNAAPASRRCLIPFPPLGMELDSCRERLRLWSLIAVIVLASLGLCAATMLLWSGFVGTAGIVGTVSLAVIVAAANVTP